MQNAAGRLARLVRSIAQLNCAKILAFILSARTGDNPPVDQCLKLKNGGDAATRHMTEDEWRFEGGVKESVCFPFEYDGPAFADRCECCCPPSLRSPVFRKIPVTPKPGDVHAATWYRDY